MGRSTFCLCYLLKFRSIWFCFRFIQFETWYVDHTKYRMKDWMHRRPTSQVGESGGGGGGRMVRSKLVTAEANFSWLFVVKFWAVGLFFSITIWPHSYLPAKNIPEYPPPGCTLFLVILPPPPPPNPLTAIRVSPDVHISHHADRRTHKGVKKSKLSSYNPIIAINLIWCNDWMKLPGNKITSLHQNKRMSSLDQHKFD